MASIGGSALGKRSIVGFILGDVPFMREKDMIETGVFDVCWEKGFLLDQISLSRQDGRVIL